MDNVSTADLLNLLLTQRSSIDMQFQFWLTITFAVLVAGFVAGHRLHQGLRWLAALLYAMASAHLTLRWMYDGTVEQHWVEELNRRGVDTRDSGRVRRPTRFLDPRQGPCRG